MSTATATSALRMKQDKGRKAAQNKEKWGQGRTYISAAVILIWCLAPAYWMVVTAFRDVGFTYDTSLLPTHVTLDNFNTAFDTSFGNHFGQALLNSVIIGVAVTAISLLIGIFAAYALARLELPGQVPRARLHPRRVHVPRRRPDHPAVPALHQHRLDRHLPGTDHPEHLVRAAADGLHLTSFFREMPWELEESARIDGCTQGQAFRKVICPSPAPAIFTTAILAFISSWNEFLIASQLSNDATQPVTVAIASFAGAQPNQIPYTAIMAAGTIVTIPLVILVLVFQRKIVAGLTAGAVK